MNSPWISNFKIPQAGQIYFDSASRSPIPCNVELVGKDYVSMQASPWDFKSNESDVFNIRKLYSNLIHSISSECIALVPSTAFAMSLAAKNILHSGSVIVGKKIMVVENEMASHVYCWQRLCKETGATLFVVPTPEDNDWLATIIHHFDPSVVVLALSSVHWCDGSLINLQALSKYLETLECKPYVIIDGTQSVGAHPINMVELDAVDFMACSVHKWLNGPYGCSLIYVHPRNHNNWLPLDHHERSQKNVLNVREWDEIGIMTSNGYPENFVDGACRLDSGGRPNPVLIPMIRLALDNLLHWEVSNIQSYLKSLTNFLATEIKYLNLGFLLPLADEFRCGHILGLRLSTNTSIDASTLAAKLKEEKVYVSARYGVLRISPYLNNTMDDCVRFLLVLARIMSEYHPVPFLPIPSGCFAQPKPMTTILMTGATGWLGQFITKKIFNQEGLELHVTYHSQQNFPDWITSSNRIHLLDLENYEQIDALIQQVRPTVFIHLAAMTSPAICAKMPEKAMAINCPSSLTYCIRKYVPQCLFIFTSTDLVYNGESPPYTVRENIPTDISTPTTIYGASKLAYERQVTTFLPNAVVLRLSNMIGPNFAYRHCGTKFLQWLSQCCEKREFVGLRSDEYRSFVAVTDVVNIVVQLIMSVATSQDTNEMSIGKKYKGEVTPGSSFSNVFNVGGPRSLSRLELGRIVAQAAGVDFVLASQDCIESSTVTSLSGVGGEVSRADGVWRVFSTTNDESVKATGIQNPRDVTMNNKKTELQFGITFQDMSETIKLLMNS